MHSFSLDRLENVVILYDVKRNGEVAEWFKAAVLKTVRPVPPALPSSPVLRAETVAYGARRSRKVRNVERFAMAQYQAQSVVYFIGGKRGAVKIGRSTDPKTRLARLQTGSQVKLFVLAILEGGEDLERSYHRRFQADRLHGEWFRRSPSLAAEITEIAARTPQVKPPRKPMGRPSKSLWDRIPAWPAA